MESKKILAWTALSLAAMTQPAAAASGETGTGVPRFGIYSDPAITHIQVWTLDDATIAFPAGCTSLWHANSVLCSRST